MRITSLALLFTVFMLGYASGEMVTLNPSKDNTLYQSVPTDSFERSNGAGERIFSGQTAFGSTRRAVLSFDVSSIPSGSTIDNVTLTLDMDRTRSGVMDMSLHRLLSDWGEGDSDAGLPGGFGAPAVAGDATWTRNFSDGAGGGSSWSTAGGDFDPIASAALSVAGVGTYTWGSTAGMVADVQSWLDDASLNFGWLLLGDETQTSAKRFSSREVTEENRFPPLLSVTYTPNKQEAPPSVPEPSAFACMGLIALLGIGVHTYRRRQPN